MRTPTKTILAATSMLLGLALAGAAGAQDGQRPAKKDPACVRDCRQETKACGAAAKEQLRECRQTVCQELVAAAREACAADRDPDACAAAREAARACVDECAAGAKEELATCRADGQACVAGCPDVRGKDRDCVLACRGELQACLEPAKEIFSACREECTALKEAAREICAAEPGSEACIEARRDALHCVRRCREALAGVTGPCHEAARECVAACPDRDAG